MKEQRVSDGNLDGNFVFYVNIFKSNKFKISIIKIRAMLIYISCRTANTNSELTFHILPIIVLKDLKISLAQL